ncbi:maestro heat-like repeat-containing protein family member 7 [Calonectris borealis]|uniref:maestro heat-like repeat-containing protein family member 7 n=2 Tax=Calonectris borealis TaxID=1323832 RepID=UPI003F4B9765
MFLTGGRMLSEDNPDHQEIQREWEAESTSSSSLLHKAITLTTVCKNYFWPSEKTDIVATAIEAMRDSSTYDKQVASSMLNMAMREPASWLTDVPSIVRCIHESMKYTSTASAWKSLCALLILLACEYPKELACSMAINVPPYDSAALAMWEMVFFQNKALNEFLICLTMIVDSQKGLRRKQISTAVLHACDIQAAVQDCTNSRGLSFRSLPLLQEHLRSPNPGARSLVLMGLMTLSERPEMARKIQVLLPDVVQTLQDANKHIRMKALLVFQSVVGHMERTKASHVALQLSGKLLPLFDDECSQLRELSIRLFKDLIKAVVCCDKRRMKNKVWRGLVPLLFHMSDQTQSVAKVSEEALLAVAEILKWEELKDLIQAQQTWRITECLLVKDRRRVEKYLHQSMPYLKDAQASLREAAIKFIGLAARHSRNQSKEELSEICRALQAMEEDSEASICSLAAQTVLILTSSRARHSLSRSLWVLRCWPC